MNAKIIGAVAFVVGVALGGIGASIARDRVPPALPGDPAHCARLADFAKYAMLQRQVGMPLALVTDQTPLWGPRDTLQPMIQRIAVMAYGAPVAADTNAQQNEFRNSVQVECLRGTL